MNEAQVRTLQQVLAGTQAMEFQAAADDEGRYAWIESVLRRFEYRRLPRADCGPVLAYLQRLSGYSRAQITRLVSRWDAGKPLVKNYSAPRHPFARLYTPADVALLVDVDRAMGTLSGPATACVLRRQRDVFGDERFVALVLRTAIVEFVALQVLLSDSVADLGIRRALPAVKSSKPAAPAFLLSTLTAAPHTRPA